ncbi:BLUF domain-containing protein [Azospirillum sp. RWY-5-1]|uniref:BLUF domain-containing protein n=1 Tax=Azospirillum oleiclasticum TaxID=2735135 RepID=A0ABX2T3T8_9PROT|nr:BLUF domain-containing protein [Azospirillum oleiclasticum]NYZ11768.1 BLUF domain-containing protein [Azospirillum oleiclasticum]NYZ18928.1 BLUF domain-containing protein [Azospirillum oleiclasticum]
MLTIMYRSEAATLLPFSELTQICLTSAHKNRALGITGFLIEFDGIFLQVLEGESDAVDRLYDRIRADPRHRNVELLLREAGDTGRSFGFWAMNFGPLNDHDFWRGVFGRPMGLPEFARRSHDPDFALEVLSRAYLHACTVADINPSVRDFVHGAIPSFASA